MGEGAANEEHERIRGIIEQLRAPEGGSRIVERVPAPLWDAIGAPASDRLSSAVRRTFDPGPALVTAPTRSATPCAIPDLPLANEIAGIDACVHCGFCLQACPTYLTLEDENDSPRGRIVLMRALVEGTLPVDDRDSPHDRVVTSVSIRAVYFSYVFVSVENWMMRSCP